MRRIQRKRLIICMGMFVFLFLLYLIGDRTFLAAPPVGRAEAAAEEAEERAVTPETAQDDGETENQADILTGIVIAGMLLVIGGIGIVSWRQREER